MINGTNAAIKETSAEENESDSKDTLDNEGDTTKNRKRRNNEKRKRNGKNFATDEEENIEDQENPITEEREEQIYLEKTASKWKNIIKKYQQQIFMQRRKPEIQYFFKDLAENIKQSIEYLNEFGGMEKSSLVEDSHIPIVLVKEAIEPF
jgi:hypothetical protein